MFTSENVQRLARIAIYNVGSFVLGTAAMQGSTGTMVTSAGVILANFLWSVYGMRINAKIEEWTKIGQDPTNPVLPPVVTNTPQGRAIAEAVPGVVIAPTRT